MSAPTGSPVAASRSDIALQWSIAILVVAQAAVVGLQVVGRHVLHSPIPWTEEIARLLLAWLMCVGGIAALKHAQHPRVTALVRLLSEPRRQAVDRGLRLVLLTFFACLIVPAYHLTVSSAGESLPASGISGAWISVILPVALVLMSARGRSNSFAKRASARGATDPHSPGRSAPQVSPSRPSSSRSSRVRRRSSCSSSGSW